jgi:Arc/MetJ-type ribon-helix-helix transcriptional regulator
VKKTSVYLSDEDAAELRALSRSTGRPQAELIREAIRRVLARKPKRVFHSMGKGRGGGDPFRHWDADELYRKRTGRS